MPAEAGWIIQCCAADLTSRSLQEADATSATLRCLLSMGKSRFGPTSAKLEGRCSTLSERPSHEKDVLSKRGSRRKGLQMRQLGDINGSRVPGLLRTDGLLVSI